MVSPGSVPASSISCPGQPGPSGGALSTFSPLSPPVPSPLEPELGPEATEEIGENLRAARSPNTRRTYATAMRKLVAWIGEHHPEVVRPGVDDPLLAILPLHVATLVDFITRVEVAASDADGLLLSRPAATGTLATYTSAIRSAHRQLGLPDPTDHPLFKEAWRGIRRRRGTRQHAKRAARWELIKLLIDSADEAASSGIRPWSDPRLLARDRALLLVGFAGAFRRSEFVSVRRQDVQLPLGPGDSVVLTLLRSKTSDEPVEVEIPRRRDCYCPVQALLAWLDVADRLELPGVVLAPADRPLWFGFQGQRPFPCGLAASSVSTIVKRMAKRAGLDEDVVAGLASHSLRSGAATSAAEAKVRIEEIKDLGRWRSLQTVDRYIQRRQRKEDHPIARLE